jgi:hypothetical protein
MIKIGKLESVELRSIWKNEAKDFTQWLASPENLELLSETIKINLDNIKTEVNVGGYKCDIVCEEETSKNIVIIENQLEDTNHDHLGKIITYASGLNAKIIIWIVKDARPEHASAIEWLNNITNDEIYFFLIQLEVLKINNSEPAVNFKLIEEPNDYLKSIHKSDLTEGDIKNVNFWSNFNSVMEFRKEFNIRKPRHQHWYDFSIGSSQCHLATELVDGKSLIRIGLWIDNNKELFEQLFKNKESIEKLVGEKLVWSKLENRKASRIFTTIENFSIDKTEDYEKYANNIIDKLVVLRNAFKSYI